MGISDRAYNRGDGDGGDYLGNPAAFLNLSMPFGTWFGARVRLHFWMLLSLTFILFSVFRVPPALVAIEMVVAVFSALLHDFGHKVAAEWVGGTHNEFVLWPAGGMQMPSLPPGAWPLFVGQVGGMVANAACCVFAMVGMWIVQGRFVYLPINLDPLGVFGNGGEVSGIIGGIASTIFLIIWIANLGMIVANFLPFYWFDGAYLLQSFLWPFLGAYRAINVTCFVGMLVAAPMFFWCLAGQSFLGMVFWALLFASAYSKRRELVAGGQEAILQGEIAYSAQEHNPRVRRWKQGNWAQTVARRAERAKRDREKIDTILQKVSAQGMNSLNWREKRTLRKATERQRRIQG